MNIGDKVEFLGDGGYIGGQKYPKWPDNYYGRIKELEGAGWSVTVYNKWDDKPSDVLDPGGRTDRYFLSHEIKEVGEKPKVATKFEVGHRYRFVGSPSDPIFRDIPDKKEILNNCHHTVTYCMKFNNGNWAVDFDNVPGGKWLWRPDMFEEVPLETEATETKEPNVLELTMHDLEEHFKCKVRIVAEATK